MLTDAIIENAAAAAVQWLSENEITYVSFGNDRCPSPDVIDLTEVICLSFAKDLESLIDDCSS